MRDIYIYSNLNTLTKFTSSRSTTFKDILPYNISQMIAKTILINTRIVISYVMKRDILLWVYSKVNGNWDNSMIRISQWRKPIVEQVLASILEQVLASEEKNKSERTGPWESQSRIWVGKLTVWVRSFEIEISQQISSVLSVPSE